MLTDDYKRQSQAGQEAVGGEEGVSRAECSRQMLWRIKLQNEVVGATLPHP